MKTLVVGCDASGKSLMLDGIHRSWGDEYGESTSSDEAVAFRKANHERVIDSEYIALREALYLDLSRRALVLMEQSERDVVTPDSSLVTRVSHSVMRQVICEPYLTNEEIIEEWKSDEALVGAKKPELIVLTHAPLGVIRNRILERQRAGNALEHFWGFNSPLFLDAYQQRWKTVLSDLAQRSYNCLSIDTSVTSPEECLNRYSEVRNHLVTF